MSISETEISDNASPELKEIRRKKRHYENKIREQLDSMIHSNHYSKVLRDGIITQRNGRFVVPVKAENRSEVAGMVHDTSGSGATVFIEPATVFHFSAFASQYSAFLLSCFTIDVAE